MAPVVRFVLIYAGALVVFVAAVRMPVVFLTPLVIFAAAAVSGASGWRGIAMLTGAFLLMNVGVTWLLSRPDMATSLALTEEITSTPSLVFLAILSGVVLPVVLIAGGIALRQVIQNRRPAP